ncbi:MAG: FAD-dependent oxidoreductase [Syntrophorhabdales bacterium]|jgi:2,4-dienoyl-CoA reductase (NADPH2)
MNYPHVFSPGRIGSLTAKNRIKYAATETNFNTQDGFVTDREIAYLEAQARGGAGIVTTQGAYPDPLGEGKGFRGTMSIAEDRFIPGLARLAEAIKRNGALAALQILHCGREGGVDLDYCLMPSVVPQRLSYFKPPREITPVEIRQAVRDHAAAARRAVEAGYDMIELSGIVGYLISTFISRYTNKRQDEYGGETVRERCRLMVEILGAIKAEIGDRVPVGIRLCGAEILDDRGGNTLEESIESFRIAEEAGADFVSVTVGWHESSVSVITRDVPMGHWLWVAERVKKAVNIPVMMAFRLFLPEIPEKAIGDGVIDFWESCRAMIADPDLPGKVAEGRVGEIVPCIACNLCFSRLYYHQPIMCSVRPSLGHEKDPSWGFGGFAKAPGRKRIGVIGGGPAGLQYAAVAGMRGHDVTLWEKRSSLGGSILLASRVDDGADELLRPIRYLEGECRKAGVRIDLGQECTPEMLRDRRLDVAVIASGARFKVLPAAGCLDPEEIIGRAKEPGKAVLIVGGDGVGLAVAVYLLNHGDYDLTIVEESGRLGRDVSPFYLWRFLKLFRERGVTFLTRAVPTIGPGKTVRISSPKGEKVIDVDDIVVAIREAPEDPGGTLAGCAPEVYFLGDAKRPRRLHNAIHDGYRWGMQI